MTRPQPGRGGAGCRPGGWKRYLPFPTRLFTDYIGHNGPERAAATIYGLSGGSPAAPTP